MDAPPAPGVPEPAKPSVFVVKPADPNNVVDSTTAVAKAADEMQVEERHTMKLQVKVLSLDSTIPLDQLLIKLFIIWKVIDPSLILHTPVGPDVTTAKEFPSKEEHFLKAFLLESIATDDTGIYVYVSDK